MLPTVITAKSHLIAAVAALSITALPATQANAWGDKEQGFLAGVVTTIIVDSLITKKKTVAPAPVYTAPAPAPVYVDPAPVYTSLSSTPAARAFNSYTRAECKAIQRKLKSWGYYQGAVDGSFGRGTYNAVLSYAADEGASSSLKSTAGAYGLYDGMLY